MAQYERMRDFLEGQEQLHQRAGSAGDNLRASVAWLLLALCELGEGVMDKLRGRRG